MLPTLSTLHKFDTKIFIFAGSTFTHYAIEKIMTRHRLPYYLFYTLDDQVIIIFSIGQTWAYFALHHGELCDMVWFLQQLLRFLRRIYHDLWCYLIYQKVEFIQFVKLLLLILEKIFSSIMFLKIHINTWCKVQFPVLWNSWGVCFCHVQLRQLILNYTYRFYCPQIHNNIF